MKEDDIKIVENTLKNAGLIMCVSCGRFYDEDSIIWNEDKPFCRKCADKTDARFDDLRRTQEFQSDFNGD